MGKTHTTAFAYRERLRLPREPRMGVVVQELVEADTAGVLFSRNPMTGSDELVIEAAWGLGESVVAGLVNVDVRQPIPMLSSSAPWMATRSYMTP